MVAQFDLRPLRAGPDSAVSADRRRGPRATSWAYGKILVGDARLCPECVIQDLSTNGARVRISRIVKLPAFVGLLFVGEALLLDAAVAWRRADEVGLTFHGHHDLLTDTDPERRHARSVWAEFVTQLYGD